MLKGIVRYSDGKPTSWSSGVCAGKQAFVSAQLARSVASRQRVSGVNYDPYRCDLCGRWHIGRSKKYGT